MLPDDNKEDTKKSGVGANGNLKPCKPGQTNNPHGRPLGSRNRSTIVKEWLSALGDGEDGKKLPYEDLITLAAVKKALTGDIQAFKELMDSAHGKIVDKQELTGKDGGAIETKGDLSELDKVMLQQYIKQCQESK